MPTPATISALREYLIDKGLVVHSTGDGEGFIVKMPLKHVRIDFSCNLVEGTEDTELLQMDGCLPVLVPADKRLDVLDFSNRINWGLNSGRFVMDPDDGEIRFRQEIMVQNMTNMLDTVALHFLHSCRMVDSFFPSLMGLIFRDTPPEEAVEEGNKQYKTMTSDE